MLAASQPRSRWRLGGRRKSSGQKARRFVQLVADLATVVVVAIVVAVVIVVVVVVAAAVVVVVDVDGGGGGGDGFVNASCAIICIMRLALERVILF